MASENITTAPQFRTVPESRKTDFELAVDRFKQLDEKYKQMEEDFLSGQYITDHVNAHGVVKPDELLSEHLHIVATLKAALSERNEALVEAKHALRSAVQLAPTQWRGPEGRGTSVDYEGFVASSATKRSFDAKTLLDSAARIGRLEKLMSLRYIDKDGREQPAIRTEYKADYQTILNWLKQEGLEEIITAAYDEEESTPKVLGPKALAFLGDKKE